MGKKNCFLVKNSCLIWDEEMWVKEREMHVNKFGTFYQCKMMFKNFRFLWRFPSKHKWVKRKRVKQVRIHKISFWRLFLARVFRCVHASLWEGLSVCRSICPWVRWSVGWSVGNPFFFTSQEWGKMVQNDFPYLCRVPFSTFCSHSVF